jgi:hypothetical protein
MTAPKEVLLDAGIHAAQRYLETLLDSGEALSPGEIEEIEESIRQIRSGDMTLADFERKHGL